MAESSGGAEQRPLVLLDGMSLAFRAFFALPVDIQTSAGVVTNALHGFASMLVSLISAQNPRAVAVAFDLAGGTFRDELTEDYKGGRAATPPEIEHQFDLIRGAQLGQLERHVRRLRAHRHHRRHPDAVVVERQGVPRRVPSGAIRRMQLTGHAHAQYRRGLSGREVVAPVAADRAERPRGINAKRGLPGF